MIFNILTNIYYLQFDNNVPDTVDIVNIKYSKNNLIRSTKFYTEEAKGLIGQILTAKDYQIYVYAYQFLDVTYVKEELGYDEITFHLSEYAAMVNRHVAIFLSSLWFVKDNSIFIEFTYAIAEAQMDVKPASIILNNRPVTTCTCSYIQSVFSEEELDYSISIFNKLYKICENFKNSVNDKRIVESLDQFHPLNRFEKLNVRYPIYNRIERAMLFLDRVRESTDLLLKIANYCMVLECLFSTEKSDIGSKLSQRIALYIGNDYQERIWIKKFITDCYTIRSTYVHGSRISKEDTKVGSNKHGLFTEKSLLDHSENLDKLLRVILTLIINRDSEIFLNDEKLIDMFNLLTYHPNYFK